jgi:hypothetical protein
MDPRTPAQIAQAQRTARYQASPKGKANVNRRAAKYRASPKGRATRAAHSADPAVKEAKAQDHRRRTYGLTPEGYAWMLEQQGGACALCPMPATHVDHDHEDGVIRGILCINCNTALGKLGDNATGLTRALHYVA